MAKGKKAREKRQDFSRQRLKVGKTAAKPHNYTNTEVRTREIAVSQQSLLRDSKGAAQLATQIGLLRHAGHVQRREALNFVEHYFTDSAPQQLGVSLPLLVKALSPLMVDDSRSVRRRLLEVLHALFDRVPPSSLAPHADMLALYSFSAMNHVAPDVRQDAGPFWRWTLERCPQVLQRHTRRCLESFAHLFGVASLTSAAPPPTGASSTASAREGLLRNLDAFEYTLALMFSSDDDADSPEPPCVAWSTDLQLLGRANAALLVADAPAFDDLAVFKARLGGARDEGGLGLEEKGLLVHECMPRIFKFLLEEWSENTVDVVQDGASWSDYGAAMAAHVVRIVARLRFQTAADPVGQRIRSDMAVLRGQRPHADLDRAWKLLKG